MNLTRRICTYLTVLAMGLLAAAPLSAAADDETSVTESTAVGSEAVPGEGLGENDGVPVNQNFDDDSQPLADADAVTAADNDTESETDADTDADSDTDSDADTEPTPEAVFDKGGDGTKSSPYLIPDLDTLKALRDYVNAGNTGEGIYFKLTADINMSGNWTPIGIYIGNNDPGNISFSGTFDGGGYEIKNLRITSDADGVGLFGNNAGTIKNLGVVNGSVSGHNETGGITGYNSGMIESCYNTCSVNGRDRIGGIAGNNTGTIQKCYNNGNITSSVAGGNGSVGGVAGDNGGTIINCYNTADVAGNNYIGGVVGFNSSGMVEKCYSIGNVTGYGDERYIGGVAGVNNNTVESCYYLEGCVTPGNNHGESISTEQLADRSTFVDWNFNGIWIMTDPPEVRPVFGYHPELPPAGSTPDTGNTGNNVQSPSGGGDYYPGAPGIAPAEYYKTETAKADETEKAADTENDAVLEDDDVSSAAGIYEDSRLIENAVPVTAVTILMAVSAVLIIKLRRKI